MKIAIIGSSGHWGAVAEALAAGAPGKVVGLAPGGADEDMAGVAERCAKDLGYAPPIYPDYRDLLDREKPDIAVVNPQFHRNGPVTLDCLDRGLHVYVEKPMSLDLGELAAIRRAWEAKPGLRLIAMQELRYLPEFLAGYLHAREGGIGRPLLLTAQKSYPLLQRPPFFRKRASYGGTIPWIGVHALDWIRWYAGAEFTEVHAAQGTAGNDGHGDLETFCALSLKLEGGALAMANLDYLRSPKAGSWGDDRIRVMGDGGGLEVRGGRAYAFARDGETRELPLGPKRLVFAEFLGLVEGRGGMLLDTEDCFRATAASLWARQAADEGKVLAIPR